MLFPDKSLKRIIESENECRRMRYIFQKGYFTPFPKRYTIYKCKSRPVITVVTLCIHLRSRVLAGLLHTHRCNVRLLADRVLSAVLLSGGSGDDVLDSDLNSLVIFLTLSNSFRVWYVFVEASQKCQFSRISL